MVPWGNSEFRILNFRTLSKDQLRSVFFKTQSQEVQISKLCQISLNTLWKILNSNQIHLTRFWHSFDLGTKHSDTGTLVTLQLPVPSLKLHDVQTQKTKQCQGNKSFTAILPKFAKICAQSALELGQRQRFHVFDRGLHPRFTPVRAPARACRSTAACAPRRAYKAAPSLDHTSPRAHKSCPSQRSSEFASSTSRHRPPWPAPSSRVQAAPTPWLASPLAHEAFQVLGPDRTSPEA
jgi:hypothetical protein